MEEERGGAEEKNNLDEVLSINKQINNLNLALIGCYLVKLGANANS